MEICGALDARTGVFCRRPKGHENRPGPRRVPGQSWTTNRLHLWWSSERNPVARAMAGPSRVSWSDEGKKVATLDEQVGDLLRELVQGGEGEMTLTAHKRDRTSTAIVIDLSELAADNPKPTQDFIEVERDARGRVVGAQRVSAPKSGSFGNPDAEATVTTLEVKVPRFRTVLRGAVRKRK